MVVPVLQYLDSLGKPIIGIQAKLRGKIYSEKENMKVNGT